MVCYMNIDLYLKCIFTSMKEKLPRYYVIKFIGENSGYSEAVLLDDIIYNRVW